MRKKWMRIVVYLMLFAMVGSTLLLFLEPLLIPQGR
ncbi:stressosome-associated protein Prli42 [Paenibacillus sanguinis]|nr:stressosome-associated protein Prli42 [Paenibacillus sanguinis]